MEFNIDANQKTKILEPIKRSGASKQDFKLQKYLNYSNGKNVT